MSKVKLIEMDIIPKCPYCEKELNTVGMISKGVFTSIKVYVCPLCEKILSIGYDRWN